MVAPFGVNSDLASCWSLARRAVARAVRRLMDAAESIGAVLFMFGGIMDLEQPEDKVSVTLILLMIKLEFALQISSAGSTCHAPLGAFPNPAFHVLPPMVF